MDAAPMFAPDVLDKALEAAGYAAPAVTTLIDFGRDGLWMADDSLDLLATATKIALELVTITDAPSDHSAEARDRLLAEIVLFLAETME